MEVVLPECGANDLPWGMKSLSGGSGVEETIQINYKTSFMQDFLYTLRVLPLTASSLLHHTQNMYISQELVFLWISLKCHET